MLMLEAQEPKLPALFRPLGGAPKLSLVLGLESHHSQRSTSGNEAVR